jgi:uncharacterized protein YpmS
MEITTVKPTLTGYELVQALIAFVHNMSYSDYNLYKIWFLVVVATSIGGAIAIAIYLDKRNNKDGDDDTKDNDRTTSSLKSLQGYLAAVFVGFIAIGLILMTLMETNTYHKVLGSFLPLTPILGTVAILYVLVRIWKRGFTLLLILALVLLPVLNSFVYRVSRFKTYSELIKYFDSCEFDNLQKCATYKGVLNNSQESFLTYLVENLPPLPLETSYKQMAEYLVANDVFNTLGEFFG